MSVARYLHVSHDYYNAGDDAIGIQDSTNIWIDHNEVSVHVCFLKCLSDISGVALL